MSSGTIPSLDRRSIEVEENGVVQFRKALHTCWVQSYEYPIFYPLTDDAVVTSWVEMMRDLRDALLWLLEMDHHVFWSQMVYGPTECQLMIDTYLEQCPRSLEISQYQRHFCHESNDVINVVRDVHRFVLLVLFRAGTPKESKTSFLTPQHFGDIVRRQAIFTIPRLLDICSLYAQNDQATLGKFINNCLFKHQPKYKHDVIAALKMTSERMSDVENRVKKVIRSLGKRPNPLHLQEAFDMVRFIADLLFSWEEFGKCYASVWTSMNELSFVERLPAFYDAALQPLLEWCTTNSAILSRCWFVYLGYSKLTLVQHVRNVIEIVYVNPLLNPKASRDSLDEHCDSFLHVLTTLLDEKHFVSAYSSQYPLAGDITRLRDGPAVEFLDPTRIDYLLDAMNVSKPPPCKEPTTVHVQNGAETVPSLQNGHLSPNDDEKVQQILEILPHLAGKREFLSECLAYYGSSSESVLEACLTFNLPPHLQSQFENLDEFGAPGPSHEAGGASPPEQSESPVPEPEEPMLQRLKSGKKRGVEKEIEDAAGKMQLKQSAAFAELADETAVWFETDDGHLLYEDEYDDTYDALDDGSNLDVKTEFDIKNLNRMNRLPGPDEESSDEDTPIEPHGAAASRPPGAKAPSRGQPAPATADQGDSKNARFHGRARNAANPEKERQQRQFKERHKGSFGGHNRKAMAAKKAGGGFVTPR